MGSSFEDLEVWKKSCRLSVRLYKLLRDCRDYGMKDQMLRPIKYCGCERINSRVEINIQNASIVA